MRYGLMLAGGLLLCAAACGDGGLFNEGPATSGGGGDGGESPDVASSASSAESSSSSGAGGDMGPGPASSSSGQGGGGEGGDGGDGGSPPDGVLQCGNETCPLQPGSACCYDAYEAYGPPQATCVTGNIANDNCQSPHDDAGIETVIECQTPAQCGAGVLCCADRETVQIGNQQVTVYVETSCQPSCDFPDIVLCNDLNSSADCPMLPTQGGGSVQGVCQQSQLLPTGYLVCGYP